MEGVERSSTLRNHHHKVNACAALSSILKYIIMAVKEEFLFREEKRSEVAKM
jgi:hypothetical protein